MNTKLAKTLSYVLRHGPHKLGLTLESGGWVDIHVLLSRLNQYRCPATLEDIQDVVVSCPKKRFTILDNKIRANQGHSIDVDLNLTPQIPPDILYHGTAKRFMNGIMRDGIQKMSRHHVHLSLDYETALHVGRRHGETIVLKIDAKKMHESGLKFFESANHVWLTDHVSSEFIN